MARKSIYGAALGGGREEIDSNAFAAPLPPVSSSETRAGSYITGKIQNAANTAGLLLTGQLPASWTRYINLTGEAGTSLLRHDKFELKYSGSSVFRPSTLPGSPEEGEFVYTSATHQFQFWNGTAWVGLSSGSVGVASVTGTANQVTVSPITGNVVVSLPASGILPGSWTAQTAFIIGTDPGGTDPLRVGGNITLDQTLRSLAVSMTFSANAANKMVLDGSANTLRPSTAGLLTLGTAALPWGSVRIGDGTIDFIINTSAGVAAQIGTVSAHAINLFTSNVVRWKISSTGHFLAETDNTYDIGASGANRPRTGYFGTSVIVGATLPQSSPAISARVLRNAIEFGHANQAGYGSTLGASEPSGHPFLAFNAEASQAGTNLFRTRGFVGRVLSADLTGALLINRLTNPNADSQALTTDVVINASPYNIVLVGSPTTVQQIQLGNSSVFGAVGTAHSSGNAFLAANATQPTTATDLWSQSLGSQASWAMQLSSGDYVRFFRAALGTPNGTQAAFWGTAILELTPTLATLKSGVDLTIGSLGRFDSTDTPNDGEILVYHAGSINKWQADLISFVVGTGDFHAALLSDNTAVAYVLETLSPTDGAVNAPGTPTVTPKHESFELRIPGSYVKTANFKRFKWETCVGASCTGWSHLIYSTSLNIVHARLTAGQIRRYQVRAESASTVSAFATTGDNTVIAGSDTEAFGGIVAGNIAAVDMAALTGDFGVVKVGQMRNLFTNPTAMLNFGGKGAIPASVLSLVNFGTETIPGTATRYLNLNGSGTFLKHDRFQADYNGGVLMYQTSSQPMFKLDANDFLLQNDAVSPTQGLLVDGTLPGGWTRYFNLNGSGLMVKHDLFELRYDGSMKMTKKVIFLTSGTSWTVPSDFNQFLNQIEVIAGGGTGASGVADTRAGGAGGGGEYRKIIGFNPGSASTVAYTIGSAGGTTTWNNGMISANGGVAGSGSSGGAGGSGGTGGEGHNGNSGGAGSVGTGSRGGGGGGGAGGVNANGSIGNAGSGAAGGDGGAGGSPNGGAGGIGAVGGDGTVWTANPGGTQAGPGGGGAGGFTGTGFSGGLFGAGGGGGGSTAVAGNPGAAGRPGIIVITYFPIGAL